MKAIASGTALRAIAFVYIRKSILSKAFSLVKASHLFIPYSICARIAKGNALRLSLSAACFPAYAMNSGSGTVRSSDELMNAQVITITVNCGDGFLSQVLLPLRVSFTQRRKDAKKNKIRRRVKLMAASLALYSKN